MELRLIPHVLLLLTRYWRGTLSAKECKLAAFDISPDAVCVDIGAHCGSWTLPLSSRVSRGQVLAIEALPYYAKLLGLLVRLVRRANITIVSCAVTDVERSMKLVWRDSKGRRLTGLTHLVRQDEAETEALSITGRPLDDIIPRHLHTKVKFIKCDVEGAELQVFKGATEILRQGRPQVYSEINDAFCRRYGHNAADVFRFFEALAYRAYTLTDRGELQSIAIAEYSGKGDILFIPGGA